MRLTLHPAADVEVSPGSRWGDLRTDLARLLCRPELSHVPLEVDGVGLGDDHLVGTRPLLPGATVRAASATVAALPDPDVVALRADWHVAVLTGDGCGALYGLVVGSPLSLALADRAHTLVVTTRPPKRPRASTPGTGPRVPRVRVRVRATGTARAVAFPLRRAEVPSARWVTPAGRSRPVSGSGRGRWRPGDVLHVGQASFDLRPRPQLEEWTVASGLAPPHMPTPSGGAPGMPMLMMALTPVVGSLALAASTRRPLFALLALVGPLTLLVAHLLSARRRRARPATDPATVVGPAGARLDGVAALDGGPTSPSGRGPRPAVDGSCLDPGWAPRPCPADLMTGAIAAHHAPDTGSAPDPVERPDPPRVPGVGAPPVPRAHTAQGARLPDGCVAVVGPRARRLAAARALVAAHASSGARIDALHPDGSEPDWAWLRWLPGSRRQTHLAPEREPGALEDGPRTVVADLPGTGAAPSPSPLGRWWAGRPAGDRLILVVRDRAAVPAWCRTVLDTDLWTWHLADGTTRPSPQVGVSTAWAERYARHVAAAARLGRWPAGSPAAGLADRSDPTHRDLPSTVSLAGLLETPSGASPDRLTEWVAHRWAQSDDPPRLVVPLGTDARGTLVALDVVRDGPHLLVAGTTGAGKSELLQTLVLGLALTTAPRDLSIALVDFKGGAGFGDCAHLPHVVGRVTDLEPGVADRAVAGLRAELRLRERVLSDAGATDIDALPSGTLPRLLVVIDELRALTEDHPDVLPGLLRVAAQGRSLGVHLVLATQRPAGTVTADVRANISLRLALRQIDPSDSRDVLDAPHAAQIPAGRPGRLVLRRGTDPPLALQCAHAAAPAPARDARVQHAARWGPPPTTATRHTSAPADMVPLLVAAARAAAARDGHHAARAPWLPALPGHVTPTDLETVGLPDDGLPLALSDLPDQQRRGVVVWHPDDGHLAVVGRPRSGRSTALRALAVAALDRGWDVHLVGSAPTLAAGLTGHPGCGTVVALHDPRRVARLIDLLLRRDGGPPVLVLLDDVEDLRTSLARVGAGAGADLLVRLLGEGPARGVHVALAGHSPGLAGLAHRVGPRLVLTSTSVPDDVAHGVPSRLAGRGGLPGRAVWSRSASGAGQPTQEECHVVSATAPGRRPYNGPDPAAEGTGRQPGGAGLAVAGPAVAGLAVAGRARGPVRLLPLPGQVSAADLRAAVLTPSLRAESAPLDRGSPGVVAAGDGSLNRVLTPGPVPVGLGGDDATPVHLDVSGGALIVGPPGSGRSSALLVLAEAAYQLGRLRVVVSRDARFRTFVAGPESVHGGADRGADGASTASMAAHRDRHETGPSPAGPPALVPAHTAAVGRCPPGATKHVLAAMGRIGLVAGDVVVVDDLDQLVQACPLETEVLVDLVRSGIVVLASASTVAAATAHRGPVAEVRSARSGLVLAPGERGSGDVFGTPLGWVVEPDGGPPGRAVAVQDGRVVPLQVVRPDRTCDSTPRWTSAGRTGPGPAG